MRVALFNWSNRLAGGAETYLANIMPALAGAGVEVGLLHELDGPGDRVPLPLPGQAPRWSIAELGLDAALRGLKAWRPDCLYAHGFLDPEDESVAIHTAPSAYFLHNYYGTCISGAKTFKFPGTRPCARVFGAPCLLQYYPRRCGGLNPVFAWRLFRQQSMRLQNLRSCEILITHSDHMREEYLRHGFRPERVFVRRFCVATPSADIGRGSRNKPPSRLLFLGRMDHLKGGHVLLDALPMVAGRLQRRVTLTLAGDGPMRSQWESQAKRICSEHPLCEVVFTGWVDATTRDHVFRDSDLLVMPSLWPEPFGQVGLEAGFYGIPSVAFDVGGVRAWLEPGTSGFLSSGSPPTAVGLADAIARCLTDGSIYSRLQDGARAASCSFGVEQHVAALIPLLELTAGLSPGGKRL